MSLSKPKQGVASDWFRASEASGDFMGIRFGRVHKETEELEWEYVSHCDCDGIGGFARLSRNRGADVGTLPTIKKSCIGIISPLWRLLCASRRSCDYAQRSDWAPESPEKTLETEAAQAVAWHLFSEEETIGILAKCRSRKVTVNSVLLQHLDEAVRADIRRPHLTIPWMIPVNIRGDISLPDDTSNHVSCVQVDLAPNDLAEEIQKQIQRRLKNGEHRANYLLLGLGKFLSHESKVKFLIKDRSKPAGNIGAFSNLGVWDSKKKIKTEYSWLFCPPVVKGQLLAAGCVTFQNRLGLAIQAHPQLRVSSDTVHAWMTRWTGKINESSFY